MFCLTYYPFEKYLEDADELKITYRAADRTLQDFLEKFKQKSIVIEGQFKDQDLLLFKGLKQKFNNFKLIIYSNETDVLNKIKEYKIPFFFNDFVGTIDKMYGLMKYQPTDMYICEQLGFSIDQVSKVLHNHNIKVRVMPNIAQSSWAETPALQKFFIRPEDINVYATYVDVFELIAPQPQQAVIYKIYKQGYWSGPIKEIIPNFKDNLDSRFVGKAFGVIRTACHKRCLYKPESCDICNRIKDLSQTFKDNNIFIRPQKAHVDFS